MNVESFSNAWKGNLSCGECSTRLNVFRKKKICIFCKNSFCQTCIVRREDKKFCCGKCQILTARPLDRNKLLNLRSRDLVNYLTSRHIPTNGCVEKEDLVNVLMRAVNNSCFHPSSSTRFNNGSSINSYPNSPRNNLYTAEIKISQSVENLYSDDGIRITGHSSPENSMQQDEFGHFESRNSSVQNEYEPELFDNSTIQYPRLSDNDQENNEKDEMKNNLTCSETNSENCGALPISKPLMLSDIKSKSDLEALSVKQLKELLMRNRTDFKGCIERAELIQKANRLWSDYIVSRKDLENLTSDELCKICMDAPIECVLLECGHMATCTTCGKQLCECPICRQFVVRCVRTFKA